MASVRLSFDGLSDLIAALKALPDALAAEAGKDVHDAANRAAEEVIAAYPEVTGNLKQHVKVVTKNAGRYGVVAQVRSTAKHADLYEFGTQARHTALGYNRGTMPPAKKFVPIMARYRRRMQDRLIKVVEAEGFTVRGQ
jgi:hypothetical protein